MTDKISFFGNTDYGKRRDNNEDAFVVENIWDEDHILAVAIDGVGGYEGGEVAAAIAQKCIPEYLRNYPNGERCELLKQAVIYANDSIFAQRQENPELSNMSCVLTAALIEVKNRRINLAHVGDTRLYELTKGSFKKLSHDHSLVGYREEIGDLTEIEAMNHPQRNIITRDVGSRRLQNNADDYIFTATPELHAKSSLLLCSDGLCDMITSTQMQEILKQDIPTNEKVNALIKAANDAGGKDNITVVLVETNFEEEPCNIATNESVVVESSIENSNPHVTKTPVSGPITADPVPSVESSPSTSTISLDDSVITSEPINISPQQEKRATTAQSEPQRQTMPKATPTPRPVAHTATKQRPQAPMNQAPNQPNVEITPVNPTNKNVNVAVEANDNKPYLSTPILSLIIIIAAIICVFAGYFIARFYPPTEDGENAITSENSTNSSDNNIPVLKIINDTITSDDNAVNILIHNDEIRDISNSGTLCDSIQIFYSGKEPITVNCQPTDTALMETDLMGTE